MVGLENDKPVYIGGESVPDPVFERAPSAFSTDTREVWNRHAGVSPGPRRTSPESSLLDGAQGSLYSRWLDARPRAAVGAHRMCGRR